MHDQIGIARKTQFSDKGYPTICNLIITTFHVNCNMTPKFPIIAKCPLSYSRSLPKQANVRAKYPIRPFFPYLSFLIHF